MAAKGPAAIVEGIAACVIILGPRGLSASNDGDSKVAAILPAPTRPCQLADPRACGPLILWEGSHCTEIVILSLLCVSQPSAGDFAVVQLSVH